MINKNVCPNCGQLYDTDLSKCPLCGTAPQVVDAGDPVQRKRITEAERKQRRADRKEAEQEARRRRKDALFMQDAEEERLIEEEEARRKEEKRRRKEEKRAARRGLLEEPEAEAEADELPVVPAPQAPGFTPGPARDGRGPMPQEPQTRDRRRVPRVFLILSAVILLATIVVGGSYLLWKLDVVPISLYDRLAAQHQSPSPAAPAETGESGESQTPVQSTEPAETQTPAENRVACTAISLSETSLRFEAAGDQAHLTAQAEPSDTTDELVFTSSDPAVVKVSSVGLVTAVGPGEASITVSCGDKQAECAVVCEFEEEIPNPDVTVDVDELILIKEDMSFFAAGENYVLSVTNIPVGTPVVWKSLDESVCTVDGSGHVVAVGAGTTRVIASVGALKAECIVRCKFE